MPLVTSITLKRTHLLTAFYFSLFTLSAAVFNSLAAQDNSPYSRYGMGDITPSNSISNRAMGGINAAYNDGYYVYYPNLGTIPVPLSINFNNPASYGSFFAIKSPTSKKIQNGKALLDVGINLENRTLNEPSRVGKFTASNALFSHVQVGLPLRPNWGISFGIRQLSNISYKITSNERLHDPNTNLPIDSAVTVYEGSGGSYLAALGTGVKIHFNKKSSLSLGLNGGYLFGKKDISTRRTIINDSLVYNSGNWQTITSYGNIYVNAGLQFNSELAKNLFLSLGAYGNWKQKLNASQDIIRETYVYSETAGNVRLDSVYDQRGINGNIDYPSSFTAGFALEKYIDVEHKKAGWLVGMDFEKTNWSDYRFYGQADPTVRNSWKLKLGGQLRPAPKKAYLSNVAYRLGAFIGSDYIYVQEKLPLFGVSLGAGFPIINYSRLSAAQTIINVSLEFIKRGNNDNLLKENMFRLSFGLSLSDLWFVKKKYE